MPNDAKAAGSEQAAPTSSTAPQGKPARPRLRLFVTAAAERAIRQNHPWVFADSVRGQNRPGEMGEIAAIYDRQNKFLALGLFDPRSPIRIRVLHQGKPVTLDAPWWQARWESAVNRRNGLFDDQTNGYRLIHGESDGWPGLVVDRYDRTLVLKIYSAIWLPMLPQILRLANNATITTTSIPVASVVLRLSRNVQDEAHRTAGLADGQSLIGPPPQAPVSFLETGLTLEADVVRGQKTGFFLDQRENRRLVGDLARGADVLNAFSFSGGFSLYAARGGARATTDIDISAHALESARRNFARNGNHVVVAACRHETIQADTFEWLRTAPRERTFDIVILDPPSMARRESERAGAIEAYSRLAAMGLARIRRGGTLVAASCSAHVTSEEFFTAVRSTATATGRAFEELRSTAHPPDHPAGHAEANYLKCIYLRLKT